MTTVSWTTDALATLRFRDRYAQEDILKDFSIKVENGLPAPGDKSQVLKGLEIEHFATPVLNGRYRVVWTRPNEDQVLVVAIAKHDIRDKADLDSLIKAEEWDWRQRKTT